VKPFSKILTFSTHINNIVQKCLLELILYSNVSCQRYIFVLMRAFNVYVRPLLEYVACVWSPYHVTKIAQIERVQRSFTKKLLGLTNLSYSDRLSMLGIESLALRRIHLDLTLASGHNTRGHSYKLLLQHSRVDVRKRFFSQRIVPIWNSLAATATDFRSLRAFRSLIAV
jgi:hypothetical protein